jgi:hypothetical protein
MNVTNKALLEQLRISHTAGIPTPELISLVTVLMEILLQRPTIATLKEQGLVDIDLAKSRIFDEDPDWCLWKMYDETQTNQAYVYFHTMIYAEFLRQAIANKNPRVCQVK